MKTYILTSYLLATLVVLNFTSNVNAQESSRSSHVATSNVLPPTTNTADADYTHVFIYYPLVKSGSAFSIFLNRKNVGKLDNGGRIDCRLSVEGPIAITIIEGQLYKEPYTQSKNSRIITVKKGKSYYFKVNGTGDLEYIFNAQKGEKSFDDAKDFNSQPTAFTETSASTIPALDTAKN